MSSVKLGASMHSAMMIVIISSHKITLISIFRKTNHQHTNSSITFRWILASSILIHSYRSIAHRSSTIIVNHHIHSVKCISLDRPLAHKIHQIQQRRQSIIEYHCHRNQKYTTQHCRQRHRLTYHNNKSAVDRVSLARSVHQRHRYNHQVIVDWISIYLIMQQVTTSHPHSISTSCIKSSLTSCNKSYSKLIHTTLQNTNLTL